MERQARGNLALQAALMATAGCVDAIGFLRLGGLFVSFMSGDSTKLVIAATHADWAAAATLGAIVMLFVAGAFVGRLVVHLAQTKARSAVLGLETLLLAIAAAIGPASGLAVAAMTMAMGVQNAAGLRRGERELPLTYVTGLLVDFAERLADAVWPRADARRGWAASLLVWLSLLAGAALGAGAYEVVAMRALALPALAAGALGLAALPRSRAAPAAGGAV